MLLTMPLAHPGRTREVPGPGRRYRRSLIRSPTGDLDEGDVGIGQAAGVDDLAPGHDRREVVDDVPHVDVHRCSDLSGPLPEGDELARGRIAAQHDRVAGLRQADVFHPEVE